MVDTARARPRRKQRSLKGYWFLLAAAGISYLIATGVFAFRYHQQLQGERLALAIARMQSGISVAEADQLIGCPPDEIQPAQGVLIHTAMFLAAGNPQAAQYGPPQAYQLRIWRRGHVQATVFVDAKGVVAGRAAARLRH